jgi:hypothetical protein
MNTDRAILSFLVLSWVGACGGLNVKTSAECDEGFTKADDGKCYPSTTGTDTGEDDCAPGFTMGDDGNCYEDPTDGDGDGDADADTDVDADTDTDTDTDTDVPGPSGDCSANITGTVGGAPVSVTNAAWLGADNIATMFVVETGSACEAAASLDVFTSAALDVSIDGWTSSLSGVVELGENTDEETPEAGDTATPEESGNTGSALFIDSEGNMHEFNSGQVSVTSTGPEGSGLIGSLLITNDAGASLTGDFSACWCDDIINLREESEEPPADEGGDAPDEGGEPPPDEGGEPPPDEGGEPPPA